MKPIYKLAALSLTIAALSAEAATPSKTERYAITSSQPSDKGHYILVTKYATSSEERVRFDFCRPELKKCSAIGNKPSYSVVELKKIIARAKAGLKQSSKDAGTLTALAIVVGIGTSNPLVAIGLPVVTRGVYEWQAYPGDHHKRQIQDTQDLIAKNQRVVESFDDTLSDLQALLSPKEEYLPTDDSDLPLPPSPYGAVGTVRLTR